MSNDAVYYSRRAQEEREAALKSTHERVRTVHLQLAEAYEAKIAQITASEDMRRVHLVDAA